MILLLWVWLACTLFLLGCGWRAYRYASAPEHLRWDLYPVAHEPNTHGGSYFETKSWWTRPRHSSLLGEGIFMAEEIFLLRGVWKHNRTLWWGSFPFHWGLYLMTVTTFGLGAVAAGLDGAAALGALAVIGGIGGSLLALGSLVLLYLRTQDTRLRPYTAPVDLMNLALLAGLGGLSVLVAAGPSGMAPVAAAVGDLARVRPLAVSPLLAAQMTVASLFLLYLPATRMVHFFSKYFTYHAVRWDDRPREAGSKLDQRLRQALDYGVAWSAPHVQTGKTWGEVATTMPDEASNKK
jgi:nitrate reductase gamma subunit